MRLIRSALAGIAVAVAAVAVPAVAAEAASAPATAPAPAAVAASSPGYYCTTPDSGWVCFYANSGGGGYSVGYTRCGKSEFPTWFWNLASSSWDRQYGGAYASAYGYSEGYSFRTYPGTGIRNVASWENDEADYIINNC